jgi:Fe2+ transport system protein FeoA
MPEEKRCCTSCCCSEKKGEKEMTLAELPVGEIATIVKIKSKIRGRKKFADVGLVVGSRIQMEAHAPLGSLIRVKVMETSMALHKADAANFVISREERIDEK